MDKDLMTTGKGLMQTEDSEYVRLVSLISGLWKTPGTGTCFIFYTIARF